MSLALNVKVVVLHSDKYSNRYEGVRGVIENTSCGGTAVGVHLDGYYNPRSANGLYWFAEDEIELIESEENIMLNPNENFLVAGVKFLDGSNQDKVYYYAMFEEYLIGDTVVVQTGHHGLALAEIVSVQDGGKDKVKCSREIVARVNMDAFYDRQAKRKVLAKLKTDMDKKVKELQETALYEMLAEKDPALASMLAEYKQLLG